MRRVQRRRRRLKYIWLGLVVLAAVVLMLWFQLSKTSFPADAFETEAITASWGYGTGTAWKQQVEAKGKSAASVAFRCRWLGFRRAPKDAKQEQVYDYCLDFQNGTVVYFSADSDYGVVEINREQYPLQSLPLGLKRQVMGWFSGPGSARVEWPSARTLSVVWE